MRTLNMAETNDVSGGFFFLKLFSFKHQPAAYCPPPAPVHPAPAPKPVAYCPPPAPKPKHGKKC